MAATTTTITAGSRFMVDLGDMKLPEVLESRIEAEIRALVLRILAEFDGGGRSRMAQSTIGRFPDGTMGLVFGPRDGGLFSSVFGAGRAQGGALGPNDHTNIVRAVMEHAIDILQYMDSKDRTANPSPIAVLSAALQVEDIDPYTKQRMQMVLDMLPQVEEAARNLSPDVKRVLTELQGQMARRPIGDQIDVLRRSRSRYRDQQGLSEAMEVAAQILEDGRSSIYADDFPFNRMLERGKRGTRGTRMFKDDIKDADGAGAVVGAAAGAFAAGIGIAPGGAVGAAGASTGWAIGSAFNWLMGWDF
jgi:hypothetical protein